MGQGDILKLMENYPDKWFSSFQLAELMGKNPGSVSSCLSKLCKQELIKTKKYLDAQGKWHIRYKLKKSYNEKIN